MRLSKVIQEGTFGPRNNIIAVSEGPGLGVTLSAKKLAHCHQLYVDHGPYDKFHDPDRPGMLCRLPFGSVLKITPHFRERRL